MKTTPNSLKAIGSITAATLSLIAIPFISISAEAVEEKTRSNRLSHNDPENNVLTSIQMTDEDIDYINALRDHFHLD